MKTITDKFGRAITEGDFIIIAEDEYLITVGFVVEMEDNPPTLWYKVITSYIYDTKVQMSVEQLRSISLENNKWLLKANKNALAEILPEYHYRLITNEARSYEDQETEGVSGEVEES